MVEKYDEQPLEEPKVKHHRDLVEAITWRFVALATEFVVAYIILGNLNVSASIALATSALLIIFYIIHRKAWRKIRWGLH
jgi:uncharacterized membrane protein